MHRGPNSKAHILLLLFSTISNTNIIFYSYIYSTMDEGTNTDFPSCSTTLYPSISASPSSSYPSPWSSTPKLTKFSFRCVSYYLICLLLILTGVVCGDDSIAEQRMQSRNATIRPLLVFQERGFDRYAVRWSSNSANWNSSVSTMIPLVYVYYNSKHLNVDLTSLLTCILYTTKIAQHLGDCRRAKPCLLSLYNNQNVL
jgi:hypothetical protein